MSAHPSVSPASLSLYDKRPFFEKALQYGVQHGIINQQKLDDICRDAPKGMVQIASYFGSEFLRPELEKAKDRIVNLISLYLEESTGGDLKLAAESLRDHSFLSRSKGGSDMLKRLIAMPQTSHFGMNERRGFTDDHIPQLGKWSLKTMADYRAELAQRSHATHLMDAAICLAEDLGLEAAELEEAGAEAEAVIRTALLTLSTQRTEMPNWRTFGDMVLTLRKLGDPDNAAHVAATIHIPLEVPDHLQSVVREVRKSIVTDLPKILDTAQPVRKLFHQTPAFMGRYFWLENGLSDVDHHDRSASQVWKKVTGGHSDEGSLLTLFLCVATSTTPKTLLTERTAATLVRKIRKSGLHPDLAGQYILAHAPVQYQADYAKLWQSFVEEAKATLLSDSDYELKDAMALIRRECNVERA